MQFHLSAALCAVSLAVPGLAADQTKDVARCAAVIGDIDRLQCFDGLAKKLGVAAPKRKSTKASRWRIDTETSPVDDSTNVTALLVADRAVQGWPSVAFKPQLMLRCKEKELTACFINETSATVEANNLDEATVVLRVEKEDAINLLLHKSTDGKGLFFPDFDALAKAIVGKATLLYGFVPFNSGSVVTSFTLDGVDAALAAVRAACGSPDAATAVSCGGATTDERPGNKGVGVGCAGWETDPMLLPPLGKVPAVERDRFQRCLPQLFRHVESRSTDDQLARRASFAADIVSAQDPALWLEGFSCP